MGIIDCIFIYLGFSMVIIVSMVKMVIVFLNEVFSICCIDNRGGIGGIRIGYGKFCLVRGWVLDRIIEFKKCG